jgi:hypothetical protein
MGKRRTCGQQKRKEINKEKRERNMEKEKQRQK